MENIAFYRNIKRLLLILLATSFVVASLLGIIYLIERENIKEEALIAASNDINMFSMTFTERISFVNTDVFILKDLLAIHQGLELDGLDTVFSSVEEREAVESEFLVWLERKNIYDQVRIIDNTGQEILRANYNQSNPEIVDIEFLQNKASRYYFSESIILDENEMFISELDLNVENGEIEIINGETKPMIRFATPIFDDAGNKLGVIVLNYLAEDILSSLYKSESSTYANIELINEDGYFLFSNDESRLWGFMYDDMLAETYSKYYDFEIFTNSSEVIEQKDFDGLCFTSLRITAETLTDKTSLLLESDISVILGEDDFIIVSSIDVKEIVDVINLNYVFLYLSVASLIVVIILSRVIDELLYNKEEKLRIIEYSATHDVLTGIPNRFHIHNLIGYKITRQHEFSLLYIDFDGFKQINDMFGHTIGDEALKAGVKRIQEGVRLDDDVARLGGDEFLVILNNLIDKNVIGRVCKNLLDSFNNEFTLNGNACKMGLSIGVSIHPKDSIISDELIDNADKAMYQIKNEGKNNYKFYEDIKEK